MDDTNTQNGTAATGTQTGAGDDSAIPAPPPIPSGEEVYNMLMEKIEPELMTAQIPLLQEKYKDETPEDAKVRAERYRKAFEEYDKKYAEYQLTIDSSVRVFSHDVLKGAETIATTDDTSALQNIESAISSS